MDVSESERKESGSVEGNSTTKVKNKLLFDAIGISNYINLAQIFFYNFARLRHVSF